jgi:Ca2+-binding EF-hand superfamily protein
MSGHIKVALASMILIGASGPGADSIYADAPAAPDSAKLTTGLTPMQQLLQLMDANQDGKVSKAEYMKFMESEFDFADVNHDGQLDSAELTKLIRQLTHPPRRTNGANR